MDNDFLQDLKKRFAKGSGMGKSKIEARSNLMTTS